MPEGILIYITSYLILKNVAIKVHFSSVIEVLAGSGYNEEGELDKDMLEKRLEREDYWSKTLRTFYPYGLNERKRKSGDFKTVGSLFFPIKRYGQRTARYRSNRNNRIPNQSKQNFLDFFNDQISNNIKQSWLEIRKYLDNCRKKVLKEIYLLFRDKPDHKKYNKAFDQ